MNIPLRFLLFDGRVHLLGRQSVAAQPAVELVVPGIEAAEVMTAVEALQTEFAFALAIATHDADVAARLRRSVELHDGRMVAA